MFLLHNVRSPITESILPVFMLHFARTLFFRHSENIVRQWGGQLDFTGDKVRANWYEQ